MHSQDMLRDHPVSLLVRVVRHHEQQVETGQEGVRKRNVLVRILVHVILPGCVSGPCGLKTGGVPVHRSDWPLRLRYISH